MFNIKSKVLPSSKRRNAIAIVCSMVAIAGGVLSWTILQPPHAQTSAAKSNQTIVQQSIEPKPETQTPVVNTLPAPQPPAAQPSSNAPVPAHSSTPTTTPLDFTLSKSSLTFAIGQISDPITATTTGGQNVDWSIISENPNVYISYNDAGGQVWLKRPPASSTRSVVLHVANPDAVAPGTYKVRIEAHYNLKTVAKDIDVTLLAR